MSHRPRLAQRPAPRGFSLIELLIALAIVGVLAAIALPSYRSYVERSHRTVAKTALSDIAIRQEAYAADHKGYTDSFARLGYGGSGNASTAYVKSDGSLSLAATGALYRLELFGSGSIASCASLADEASPTVYVISATPILARTDTRCGAICLSSTGQRGSTAGTADSCWAR